MMNNGINNNINNAEDKIIHEYKIDLSMCPKLKNLEINNNHSQVQYNYIKVHDNLTIMSMKCKNNFSNINLYMIKNLSHLEIDINKNKNYNKLIFSNKLLKLNANIISNVKINLHLPSSLFDLETSMNNNIVSEWLLPNKLLICIINNRNNKKKVIKLPVHVYITNINNIKIREISFPNKMHYSYKIKHNVMEYSKKATKKDIEKILEEYNFNYKNIKHTSYESRDVHSLDNASVNNEINVKKIGLCNGKTKNDENYFNKTEKSASKRESHRDYIFEYVKYMCSLIMCLGNSSLIKDEKILRDKNHKNVTLCVKKVIEKCSLSVDDDEHKKIALNKVKSDMFLNKFKQYMKEDKITEKEFDDICKMITGGRFGIISNGDENYKNKVIEKIEEKMCDAYILCDKENYLLEILRNQISKNNT